MIVGCITESEHLPTGLGYYGLPVRESLATVVHPNELLDGAVTGNTLKTIAYYPTTWDWQNHPLALRLSREHGRRLDFAGVVLQRIRFESFREKEVAAQNAAQVARALGAEAALITWLGSGNAFLEVMLTVRACEQKGIKTVLVTYEYGGRDGTDSPLLFYDDTADAVVSTGTRDRTLELPAAERVVGAYERLQVLNYPGAPVVSAFDPMSLDAADALLGATDLWGGAGADLPGALTTPLDGVGVAAGFKPVRAGRHQATRALGPEPDGESPLPVEVICIDHVFIPVRDLAAAEAFYDRVMPILGFRKGRTSDKVSPRARYDNRHLTYWIVLREGALTGPDAGQAAPSHLCFRVADEEAVNRACRETARDRHRRHRAASLHTVLRRLLRDLLLRPRRPAAGGDQLQRAPAPAQCSTGTRKTARDPPHSP